MNLLFILSDEHNRDFAGCYGHPLCQTPHLDQLAARGVTFDCAYTNSPLCVPARAALATGRYVHELGTWDNATAYAGQPAMPPSWGHQLDARGIPVTAFGKFDHCPDVDDGFYDQRSTSHRKPPGDIEGLYRDPVRRREGSEKRFDRIGPIDGQGKGGDFRSCQGACQWLKEEAPRDQPWVLYVGYGHPHFPLLVRQALYDKYDALVDSVPDVMLPPFDLHPVLQELRMHFSGEAADEDTIRRAFVSYCGMCEVTSELVGALVQTVEEEGLADDTLIIYTTDHGEILGMHGLWWKCAPYEGAAAVPLIIAGPGAPEGRRIKAPVSLVDLFPTICEVFDADVPAECRGHSLWPLIRGEADSRPDYAFSEYHGHGVSRGWFVIRRGPWKYIHIVDHDPLLFHLDRDPEEKENLAPLASTDQAVARMIEELDALLRQTCDPEAVDARAHADQRAKREAYEADQAGNS